LIPAPTPQPTWVSNVKGTEVKVSEKKYRGEISGHMCMYEHRFICQNAFKNERKQNETMEPFYLPGENGNL
jgi:hypothetical protein